MSQEELPGDDGGGGSSASLLHGAARATVLLTFAGVFGQIFTLIRELFIAAKVGATVDLDAVLVAAVFPMMLASLLASGTASAIVPGYLEAVAASGRQAAERLLGATLTWTVVIGVALAIAVDAFAGVAVTIAGPGLEASARATSEGYVPYLAPILVLSAVSGLLAATFQIHDRMRGVAIAWLLGPVASVFVTIGFYDTFGLTALAVAMTVQQAVTVAVLIALAIRNRILPPFTLRANRAESARFIRHATPLTISSSVLQLNLLTDRAVATLLAPGAVSALRYAEGVLRIPLNAIGPAWNAAIYPALVRASVNDTTSSLGEAAAGALRYVIAMFVPLSVATSALAPLIVQVAYVRGAFQADSAQLTSAALAGFGPLLVLTLANSVLTGAHNARRRGVFLMAMGILNAVLNAVFDIGLGLALGVAGVALSTSLTVGFVQFLKAWRLGAMDEGFPLRPLLLVSARSLAASLIVGVPIAIVAWDVPIGLGLPLTLALLVSLATAGMVGYIAVGRMLGLREPVEIARVIVRAPMRLRSAGR